ncbi:MAG: IclR family transcriptional regulator [Alphaproteobacteria bacterium]
MPEFDSPAAKVLAVMAEVARTREASVSGLALALRMPASTVHRIASELERLGYLQRVPGLRSWTVAAPAIELAADVLEAGSWLAKPQAILREISEQVGEMCTFGIRGVDEVVYVASAEPRQELALYFRAGRTGPLHCTSSGRLFLARFDDAELQRYLSGLELKAYTPSTVTDPARLLRIVRRVREQGYAVTNNEYVPHISGAAVPVVGPGDTMYGTLGVTAPEVRTGPQRLKALVPQLKAAATRLAACYRPRPDIALARSA